MGASRLDSLTGLRWLAALGVFIAHTYGLNTGFAWFTWIGWSGVTLFFILSGFVLAWSASERDGARSFYRRRFARVYPLHILTLALAVAVLYFAVGRSLKLGDALLVITLFHGWYSNGLAGAGNPVAWSLSDEAFFYALFPLLALVKASRRGWLTLTLVALAMPWLVVTAVACTGRLDTSSALMWYALRSPVGNLCWFVAGIGLSRAIQRGWTPMWSTRSAALAVGLSAVLLLTVPTYLPMRPAVASHLLVWPALAPAFAALIASLASADIRGRSSWLASRPLVALGAWSFAFYLVHLTVLGAIEEAHGGPFPGVVALALAALALGVSIGLAGLLHNFVEVPLERRLRGPAPKRLNTVVAGVQRAAPTGATSSPDWGEPDPTSSDSVVSR